MYVVTMIVLNQESSNCMDNYTVVIFKSVASNVWHDIFVNILKFDSITLLLACVNLT